MARRIFSMNFSCTVCIQKTILKVQEICESKLEHHTTCRNDDTTGESEFVEIQKMKHAYPYNISWEL